MITKAGELIEYLATAVETHGAHPLTNIRVRIGALGPTYVIQQMQGANDGRGLLLILQTAPLPESL